MREIKSVCVVDDDAVHLEIMSFMLRRMGFRDVVTFSGAEEALDYVSSHDVHLIVSDWNMSPMSGMEFLEKVRSSDRLKHTPFLMVTANCSESYWRDAIKAGATTINIPSDLTIPQIASIRAAIQAPIDFYVEAPDNIGGFIRYFEIPELIRVAAPIYLKFGLRNSPDIYPSGTHIEGTVLALSRERVRRASLAMQTIARYCPDAVMSPLTPGS